jgi:acetyl-CoA carboxylase biotin carboxyl carrier protein
MSDDVAGDRQPFDLQRLRELIELMEKHDVTEVRLRQGDEKWCVRRGPQDLLHTVPISPFPVAPVSAAPEREIEQPPAAETLEETGLLIKSPTVGTYYSAPSPDDPPFVTIGVKVQPDTIVCMVEAMKVFNQIPAEVSGIIVEILVANGDPVEFGQPLFRVQPG